MADLIDPLARALLARGPALLQALVAGLPPAALQRPNPEGWSVKDIVAHLHDTEGIAFTERIHRILDEDEPLIVSIDPPMRLAELGYGARTLDDLLAELATRRAANLDWLASLTAEQLARVGRHDTAGPITPADLVSQWAFHDLAHSRQIMELLQAPLTAGMGGTLSFYPEARALAAWP